MTTAISSLNRAPKAMTYFEPSAVHSVSDPWPDLASEIPGQSASQSGHLSNQARSVRAWLLHACLVLGILLSDLRRRCLRLALPHVFTQRQNMRDSKIRIGARLKAGKFYFLNPLAIQGSIPSAALESIAKA